jgi:hypothetical protein
MPPTSSTCRLISGRRVVNLLKQIVNQMETNRSKTIQRKDSTIITTLAEIDIQTQKERAMKYIQHKLNDLKYSEYGDTYTDEILKAISRELIQRTGDNLLWACLVLGIMGSPIKCTTRILWLQMLSHLICTASF